jgi:hypothetical protein
MSARSDFYGVGPAPGSSYGEALYTMSDLRKVLEQHRPAIEAGLAQAERELAELDARRGELLSLIARARAALGETPPAARPAAERLTLHEAMALVLRENDNDWMTVRSLADAVNERGLYEKRDGSPVDPSQVHARANKYRGMFEKDGRRLRLIE